MVRPSSFQKLRDRFKPNIFERMGQSKAARDKNLKKVEPAQVLVQAITGYQSTAGSTTSFGNSACDPWQRWMTSPITVSSNDAWNTWNSPLTAGTATTIWRAWTTHDTGADTGDWIINQYDCRPPNYQRSTLQRVQVVESEADKREARRYREQREAEAAAREVAYKRAMGLLMSFLNPEQRECLKERQYFLVKAKSGRLYRIDEGTHGNVKVIHPTTKKILETLCIQPNGVPAGDAMLSQMLMIETSEELFRRHANITLADGQLIKGDTALLDGNKLARVISLKAA